MTEVANSVYVSLAYRYWDPTLTPAENQTRYGDLASEEGLGGNWQVEVGAREEADLAKPLAHVKALLDHRCIWQEIAEFHNRPATLENITRFVGQSLRQAGCDWHFVRIYEHGKTACVAWPNQHELGMEFKAHNLTLFCRAAVAEVPGIWPDREAIVRRVAEQLKSSARLAGDGSVDQNLWAKQLFEVLNAKVANLRGLRIDLGRHGFLQVLSDT